MRARRSVCLLLLILGLVGVASPLAAQLGDGDGDGVRDGLDLCPNERGPIANLGCAAPRTGMAGAVVNPSPPLVISGRVWNDRDGDGSQDADEPGLADVPVELWDANRATRLYSARTDGAGFYTLVAPAAGLFRVRVPPVAGTTLTVQDAGITGDAVDSDVHAAGVDAGFSDVIGVTTAIAAAPRIDAGLRPPQTPTPTPNLFSAQAAPALTLVLAPSAGPSATFGLDINLPVTMSPDEYQNQAATHLASLNNPPGQNRTPTATRFPGPNLTQIAQWQTAMAGQTLTAAPTVTGTLSATPTPTSSPTPTVTPTGTLPTATPTIDPRALTALFGLGTAAALQATVNATIQFATLQAANQSLLSTLSAALPSNTPFPFSVAPAAPAPTPTPISFSAQAAPALTLVGVPLITPTPTRPVISVQPAPAVGVVMPTSGANAQVAQSSPTPAQPGSTSAFDRDGDFIPDTLDACPDAPNLTPDGCPLPNLDRDGDGTLDYADACPDQPGDLTSRAHDMECPDTDNDGWTDNVDDCPDQPALLFGGCPAPPDRDGDGVLDSEDQCPDVRHESSSGCPDSDGDGLNDSGDACPNQPAPLSANGCPTADDRDGDTIPNQLDRCPDSFNLTLNGCPPGVSEFTPTPTPTITPASVDLTGPTPGLVFIPSPVPTNTPIPQVGSPLDGAQVAITVIPEMPTATPTGLIFSGQAAPALTLVLAPSVTPAAILIEPGAAVQAIYTETPSQTPLPDRDGDGWWDGQDVCPYLYASPTSNGCPVNDRDGDDVPNTLDRCPDASGITEYGSSADGCPFTDPDGDGLSAPADRCPDQAAPLSPNGCPLSDRDGDGYPDVIDQCPDLAETLADGVQSATGCPSEDRDKDGIYDVLDACPDEPSPFVPDGCPGFFDRDGDGITNAEDSCPETHALTFNGCPPGLTGPSPTFTQTIRPSITPASVDLTGPTPGLVFVPSPVPTNTPIPQVGSPLDGAQVAVTLPLLPSATPTGLIFSGQAAPALTLALAPSATPSPPGVIGISPTPAGSQGLTPTPTLTPNLIFQPPIVRAPASLIWDPFSTGPLLSTRNLNFSDPNPPGSGAQLVVALSVANGELFTFDPVAGRLGGRRLVFDSTQELANLLAGVYYRADDQASGNVRLVLQAFYLRGLNDRSPTVTVEISLVVPAITPPG